MEFDASKPIYAQVVEAIKKDIASGKLQPGDKLPSTRDLAVSCRINPNTAARVYQELDGDGVTETRRGMGTYVRTETGLTKRMRDEMASEFTGQYVEDMHGLGFDRTQTQLFLQTWGTEKGMENA